MNPLVVLLSVIGFLATSSLGFAPVPAQGPSTCTRIGASTDADISIEIPPIESTPASHPLIQAAHKFAYSQSGFYSPHDESVLAEDFVFRGPYIGPLNKKDYMSTMDTFGIYRAFPDISPNCFGYSLDPENPNRVWFMVRNTGTFTGKPGLGLGAGNYFPPNGATLKGCPETFSITFDEQQKIKYLSVGYVADRFEGNTKGKGAAVGIFEVIGLPFPKPGPLLQFVQWLGTDLANQGAPSYSKDVPSWWRSKSDQVGADGY